MCSSLLKVRFDFFHYEIKPRERRARTNLQETYNFSSNDKRDDD